MSPGPPAAATSPIQSSMAPLSERVSWRLSTGISAPSMGLVLQSVSGR